MGYKVNHYASKSVKATPQLAWETLIIEAAIGIICGAFAIGGYNSDMLILIIPCGIIALICAFLVSHSIVSFIREKRETESHSCGKSK